MNPRVTAAAGIRGVPLVDNSMLLPSIELRVEFDLGYSTEALDALQLVINSVRAQIAVTDNHAEEH